MQVSILELRKKSNYNDLNFIEFHGLKSKLFRRSAITTVLLKVKKKSVKVGG